MNHSFSHGLFLSLLLVGCGLGCGYRSTSLLDRDATSTSDAASTSDADATSDATSSDAGPDAPAPDAATPADTGSAGMLDTRLGRALHCEMDDATALRAVVREVACWDDGDLFPSNDPTVRGLFEAWEAGLLGTWEPGVATWFPGFRERGCQAWRCAAEAGSCAGLAACDAAERIGATCELGNERCEGNTIARCIDGAGLTPIFDCATAGATCNSAVCQLGDCNFGLLAESLTCEGDSLSLCDGAVTVPCSEHGPGDMCGAFYIGGEIPTRWCSPSAGGTAGAYNTPIDCAGGRISFTSVSERAYTFDCPVNGYAGCDESGCTQ